MAKSKGADTVAVLRLWFPYTECWFSHDAAHLCIQNILLLTKRQSTFHIYQCLNDLNGDLGICILITKMFVFLEIDQMLARLTICFLCTSFNLLSFVSHLGFRVGLDLFPDTCDCFCLTF